MARPTRQQTLPEPDEKQLIDRAKAFDAEALSEIYERYHMRIYCYVYSRVGSQADAEDLTALVFLKCLEGMRDYQDRGLRLSSWLFRIAHNVVVDRYRRGERQVSLDAAFSPALVESQDPQEQAIANLGDEYLRDMMKELTAEQQQVLSLRFGADMDPTEIARVMGRRVGSVHALQFRALKSLHRILSRRGLA